jgi:RHS repeat-associated protein
MPKGNASRTIDANGDLTGTANNAFSIVWTYYGISESAAPPAACGGSAVNQAGLLKSETPNGIAITTVVYDVVGRPRAITKGAGSTCRTYSNEGRLLSDKAPGETDTTKRTYTYDPVGALRTAIDGSGTVTLEYDEAGRLKRSVDTFGAEATFVYDAESRLTQRNARAFAGGTSYASSYTYNERGALKTLTDPAGRLYRFAYDNPGRLNAVQYPNGTFAWNTFNTSGWQKNIYVRHGTAIDTNGNLIDGDPGAPGIQAPADASPIVEYTYAYDNTEGRKTSETRSGAGLTTETTTYNVYDGQGRLEKVTLPSGTVREYGFDLHSNRTQVKENNVVTETYVYDPSNPNSPGLDQLTSRTKAGQTKTFSYTGDGQATSSLRGFYTWDGRGRIRVVYDGPRVTTYEFDPLGRMRTRHYDSGEQGPEPLGIIHRDYIYADPGEAPLFEITTEPAEIKLTDVDGPVGDLAHYGGPPTTGTAVNYLYYNGHGDLAAAADQAGSRTGAYTYDPFGTPNLTLAVGSAFELWTGRWDKKLDTSSSLIQMGVRAYDPALGRFVARDPIVGGSLNLYDYAGQEPVSTYDLSGLWCSKTFCGAIVSLFVDNVVKPYCGSGWPGRLGKASGVCDGTITGLFCTGPISKLAGLTHGCYGIAYSNGHIYFAGGCCASIGASVTVASGPPGSGPSAGGCYSVVCFGGNVNTATKRVTPVWGFGTNGLWAGYFVYYIIK